MITCIVNVYLVNFTMLVIVYFDDFYKDLIRKINKKYKLVHYTQIPSSLQPSALIICGSKKRILREPQIAKLDKLIENTSGPVIGICYGFQYLAQLSGGKIEENATAFRGVLSGHHYNHYDKVVELPRSWTIIEREKDFISVATTRNWIGFQFHPEKTRTNYDKYIGSII